MEHSAKYSLTAIPDAHGEVKRMLIEKRRVYWSVIVALYAVGLLLAAVVHYTYLWSSSLEAQDMAKKNDALRAEVAALAAKVDQVENNLGEARRFDEKLRAMTDLNDDTRDLSVDAMVSGSPAELLASVSDPAHRVLVQAALDARFEGMADFARSQAQVLGAVVDDLARDNALHYGVPREWPTGGWITSRFGPREDPATQEPAMHLGLDVAAPVGAEVRAPASGRVLFSGVRDPLGNVVVVDHGRDVVTHYGHLQEVLVRSGDLVEPGQAIGLVGSTGRSTGPHLHYEIRVAGLPVNPENFLAR